MADSSKTRSRPIKLPAYNFSKRCTENTVPHCYIMQTMQGTPFLYYTQQPLPGNGWSYSACLMAIA
jgi:hypothetical protein